MKSPLQIDNPFISELENKMWFYTYLRVHNLLVELI